MIKFEQTGRRPDGEKLYRLVIDDEIRREGMTLDEVIAVIHRSDGEDHAVRLPAAERRRMARKEPSETR